MRGCGSRIPAHCSPLPSQGKLATYFLSCVDAEVPHLQQVKVWFVGTVWCSWLAFCGRRGIAIVFPLVSEVRMLACFCLLKFPLGCVNGLWGRQYCWCVWVR